METNDILLVVLIALIVSVLVTSMKKGCECKPKTEQERLYACGDDTLGQAPLGNPQTWTRVANPLITGMY